jgi:hypothetical protein
MITKYRRETLPYDAPDVEWLEDFAKEGWFLVTYTFVGNYRQYYLRKDVKDDGSDFDPYTSPAFEEGYNKGLQKGIDSEKKRWIDEVMMLIDGHYDNPNLAGNLEDLAGVTFQEWNKEESNDSK